jgi:aldehyde:ferredoxin oxidoreductase
MQREDIFGYHGKLLRIDLTKQTHQTETISPNDRRLFLGGRGLGAALLLRELPAKVDPLSPDNIIIFSTGPLVGSPVPGTNRYVLQTKSPQTGFYSFSVSGGRFGRVLKRTGFDQVLISGKSPQPTYLLIDDEGRVEFKAADHLWGQDTQKTQEAIRSEVSPDTGISCIGPAGENMVPYACLINERRALGRGGAGAVMGSKNLKAVAVRGRLKTPLAEADRLKETIRKGIDELGQNPMTSKVLKLYGELVRYRAGRSRGHHRRTDA